MCPTGGVPPWAQLAAAVLRRAFPGRDPGLALALAPMREGPDCLPPPLARMAAGLCALGPPDCLQLAPAAASLGGAMPLWANPALQLEFPATRRSVPWPAPTGDPMRNAFGAGLSYMAVLPGLRTVADLVALQGAIQRVAARIVGLLASGAASFHLLRSLMSNAGVRGMLLCVALYGRTPWAMDLAPEAQQLLGTWGAAGGADRLTCGLQSMLAVTPDAWLHDASRRLQGQDPLRPALPAVVPPADSAGAARALAHAIAFRPDPAPRPPRAPQPPAQTRQRRARRQHQPRPKAALLRTDGLTVRSAVQLQRRQHEQDRQSRVRRFAAAAAATAGIPYSAALPDSFAKTRAEVWKRRWNNAALEVLWRLPLNGVRGAGGHDIEPAGPCPCGWVPQRDPDLEGPSTGDAWRTHAFWECPVAKAVVAELARGLSADGQSVHVHAAHLWLLSPPSPHVDLSAWRVICIAALNAMDTARRRMWAAWKDSRPAAAPDQPLITAFFPSTAPLPRPMGRQAREAATVAVAELYTQLQDFVFAYSDPPAYLGLLGSDHPFIRVVEGPGGGRRLAVSRPAH